ncbi:uncharacterized protein K441DRAFT_699588 [Cenococcum geophilum 1.58]|uniref:uncharacterized protein n=1 Tax=Cenococcum geophilum 1.58 TaxID=794803 RepID=UPI00358E97FC|nr:hypothetical protein K441DRAFT_699588 [Cenococcum geophilum 1.58]
MSTTQPNPENGIDSAVSVFWKSCRTFEASLSDTDKAFFEKFQSPREMLKQIKHDVLNHKIQRSTMAKCARRIEVVSTKFSPFFGIIDIFVQTHPEYAGIFWGAIRLVFLWGSNFTSFLEKTCEMFEFMVHALPAYEDAAEAQTKLLQNRLSARILDALSMVYSDILEFCAQVCRILSPDRNFSRKAKTIWKLSWTPFHIQFGGLLESFKKHAQIFKLEVKSYNYRLTVENNRKLDKLTVESNKKLDRLTVENNRKLDVLYEELKNLRLSSQNTTNGEAISHQGNLPDDEKAEKIQQTINAVKTWIKPPEWQDIYESASARRLSGTGDWISQNRSVKFWLSRLESAWLRAWSGNTEAAGALRAWLVQLIHAHQDEIDEEALGAMTMLMRKAGSGQQRASGEEIVALLKWFLYRYPRTIMIIDGVEETDNPDEFFRLLSILMSDPVLPAPSEAIDGTENPAAQGLPLKNPLKLKCAAGILVFARPSVSVPDNVICDEVTFDRSLNQYDIEWYLESNMHDIVGKGFLGRMSKSEVEKTSRLIVNRADGMFLFAKLLVEYLKTEGLFVTQRKEVLRKVVLFEGLEELYGAILSTLQRILPPEARRNLQRAFEWTAESLAPLHFDQLQDAIRVSQGHPISVDDIIPNFEKQLGRFSGALLEPTSSGKVTFIHSTLVDYLSEDRSEHREGNNHKHEFYLNRQHTRMRLGLYCTSFLSRIIPHGPLGGQSDITPSCEAIKSQFPILNYMVKYWTPHIEQSIATFIDHRDEETERLLNDLITELHSFSLRKKAVMTWIEACWLFRIVPSMDFILAGFLEDCFRRSWSKDLQNLTTDLLELSNDVQKLNQRWDHVLSAQPNEIWEPSILTLSKSRFWLETDKAKSRELTSVTNDDPIVISLKSEVSTNGLEVGQVNLIPPRCPSRSVQKLQRRRLFVQRPNTSNLWLETIAGNLRKVQISNTLLTILDLDQSIEAENARGCSFIIDYIDPWQDLRRERSSRNPVSFVRGTMFSPLSNFLLLVDAHHGLAILKFDKDQCTIFSRIEGFGIEDKEGYVLARHACFHPFLPILAVVRFKNVSLWDFSQIDNPMVSICSRELEDLQFSTCGNFVFGFDNSRGVRQFIFLGIAEEISKLRKHNLIQAQANNYEQSISSLLNDSISQDATPNNSQKPNAVVFGKDAQGVASASMLREFHEEGTLLLTTLRQDGIIRTETLSRLPKDYKLTEAVVAMPSEDEKENIFRIVINVKPKLRHSISPDEKRLPVVIERKRCSVPTFERKRKRGLSAGQNKDLRILKILKDGRKSEGEGD